LFFLFFFFLIFLTPVSELCKNVMHGQEARMRNELLCCYPDTAWEEEDDHRGGSTALTQHPEAGSCSPFIIINVVAVTTNTQHRPSDHNDDDCVLSSVFFFVCLSLF
jgi:hypothetical protein